MRSFQTKSRLTHKEKPKKSNRGTAKRTQNKRNQLTNRLRKAMQNQSDGRTIRLRKAMKNQSDGRTIRGGSNISDYFTSAKRNLAETRLKRIHNSIVNAANRYNEQATIIKNKGGNIPGGYPREINGTHAIRFQIDKSGKLIHFDNDRKIPDGYPHHRLSDDESDNHSIGKEEL